MPRRLSPLVLAVALLAGGLSVAPYLRAQVSTPPGWEFTGNLRSNPDYMQYRVWFRQTQREGPVVRDVFTTEDHGPHLVLIFPFVVGKVAGWLHVPPEFVYAYLGGVLAFVFTLLLWAIVSQFIQGAHQRWWIFLALLFGGGLGGHLKVLLRFDWLNSNPIVKMFFWDAVTDQYLLFEDYRGHFAFTTLFDTHYLLNWTLCALSVMSVLAYLRRPTAGRLATTFALSAFITTMHLYEGITLLSITAGIAGLSWARRIEARQAVTAWLVSSAGVLLSLGGQALIRTSDLPIPDWRGTVILPAILFVAYPLSWALAAWGLPRLWRSADVKIVFLLGWLLGCLVLTQAGPFYPYPDRGVLTMQIPLTILAGLAYFGRYPRVTTRAAVIAVLILGVTPVWYLARMANEDGFAQNQPAKFLNQSHRDIVDALLHAAAPNDVLLADEQSLRWLAPDYPGRHYSAHFFLTVDFDRKRQEVNRFYTADPQAQADFLKTKHIRFVFVDAQHDPARFAAVPGLSVLIATSAGTVFTFQGAASP